MLTHTHTPIVTLFWAIYVVSLFEDVILNKDLVFDGLQNFLHTNTFNINKFKYWDVPDYLFPILTEFVLSI